MSINSGTISTQNLTPTAAPTNGSIAPIKIPLNQGASTVNVNITGTWTCSGGLVPMLSLDGGQTFESITAPSAVTSAAGVATASVPSGGTNQYSVVVPSGGLFQLSANGAFTGSAFVTLTQGPGTSAWGGIGGNASGGGAVTIADGADITLGAIADAAVTTSATGTVSGKLRGIISLLVSGIKILVNGVTTTDVSGTIAAGSTAQTATASNANRKYICLSNLSTTENMNGSFATTASATVGFLLLPGGSYTSDAVVPTGALSVFAATTGHPYGLEIG